MNTFVINYFLSAFSLFLSKNAFKKMMFWFFKYQRIAFSSLLLSALSCPLPWFLNRRKGEGHEFWGLKLKGRGLNWMRRHFSVPSQSPGQDARPRLLPCPALPNSGASAHLRIPSPETLHHPSVAGRHTGKGCLPGTLNIVCPHLCSSPNPSVTLLLTSWQWALFQN